MRKLLIFAFASMLALWVHAADLVVTCNVTAIDKGRTQTAYKKKFEIDLEPHYFKVFVDKGNGFRVEDDGFPKVITEAKITFVEDNAILEYYERKTGKYLYKNNATGLDATGTCTKVSNKK